MKMVLCTCCIKKFCFSKTCQKSSEIQYLKSPQWTNGLHQFNSRKIDYLSRNLCDFLIKEGFCITKIRPPISQKSDLQLLV